MTRVIVFDHSEAFLRDKLSEEKHDDIESYRKNVLPVLGYYDDHRSLKVVSTIQ